MCQRSTFACGQILGEMRGAPRSQCLRGALRVRFFRSGCETYRVAALQVAARRRFRRVHTSLCICAEKAYSDAFGCRTVHSSGWRAFEQWCASGCGMCQCVRGLRTCSWRFGISLHVLQHRRAPLEPDGAAGVCVGRIVSPTGSGSPSGPCQLDWLVLSIIYTYTR